MLQITGGTGDRDNIDLQHAEYSDDDLDYHFTQKELIDYLNKIEEDNLFNINLCQSDEQQLEDERIKANAEIEEMEEQSREQ